VQLERTVGSKTARRYLCSLKQLAPWLEEKAPSAINGPLVASICTIRRDLGALSNIMNFAILQGWIEVNPVVPKLALVPEKHDPILLPADSDISLVIERAPWMVGQMVMAALKIGPREVELVRAKRGDLDHSRKQLTVISKGNKLR
jgi:integrase/recombinase XerD